MADTDLTTVVNQIQEYWSPVYAEELRLKQVFPTLINAADRVQPGSIIREGNKVRVSQVNELTGVDQAAGTKTYVSESLSLSHVDVTIDRRAYASLEFVDVVELQSQINMQRADVREAMMRGMMNQVNTQCYTVLASDTPTVEQTSVASINAAKLTELKQLADAAGWSEMDRWLLVDPLYMKNLLDDSTLTSADFVPSDRPVVGGQFIVERYGWKILMDNSAAFIGQLNAAGSGCALAFTSNFMHYVNQSGVVFKASDAHANNEFSIKATVHQIYGVDLGIDSADRHIIVRTGA